MIGGRVRNLSLAVELADSGSHPPAERTDAVADLAAALLRANESVRTTQALADECWDLFLRAGTTRELTDAEAHDLAYVQAWPVLGLKETRKEARERGEATHLVVERAWRADTAAWEEAAGRLRRLIRDMAAVGHPVLGQVTMWFVQLSEPTVTTYARSRELVYFLSSECRLYLDAFNVTALIRKHAQLGNYPAAACLLHDMILKNPGMEPNEGLVATLLKAVWSAKVEASEDLPHYPVAVDRAGDLLLAPRTKLGKGLAAVLVPQARAAAALEAAYLRSCPLPRGREPDFFLEPDVARLVADIEANPDEGPAIVKRFLDSLNAVSLLDLVAHDSEPVSRVKKTLEIYAVAVRAETGFVGLAQGKFAAEIATRHRPLAVAALSAAFELGVEPDAASVERVVRADGRCSAPLMRAILKGGMPPPPGVCEVLLPQLVKHGHDGLAGEAARVMVAAGMEVPATVKNRLWSGGK